MLRSLKSLYHSKIHNAGNESEGLVVILQRMAVDIGEDAVLFQLCDSVFNLDSDPPLLLVEDFLRSGKFRTTARTFERNGNNKIGIIFFNTLISIVNEERRVFRNHLRKTRFLKKLVVVRPSANCRRYMDNQSVSFGRDLGF